MAIAAYRYDVIRVTDGHPDFWPEEYGMLAVRCEGEYLATAADLARAQEIIADELGIGPIELRAAEDEEVEPRWIVGADVPDPADLADVGGMHE